MPTPTTPDLLQDALREVIKGLTPRVIAKQSARFVFRHSRSDVETGALRIFTLELTPNEEGTTTSCGNDFPIDLDVVVSYRGLKRYEAQSLIVEDRAQLWQAIIVRQGTIAGLFSAKERGAFEWLSQDDSECWGIHPYTLRYVTAASGSL